MSHQGVNSLATLTQNVHVEWKLSALEYKWYDSNYPPAFLLYLSSYLS